MNLMEMTPELKDKESRFKEPVLKAMQLMAEHGYIMSHDFETILGYRKKVSRYGKALGFAGLVRSFDTLPINGDKLFWNSHHARKAYCLTRKGYRLLEQIGRLRIRTLFHPGWFRVSTMSHTGACIQTRLRFEGNWAIRGYFPERVLSASDTKRALRDVRLLPDAEFDFQTLDNGRFNHWRAAIEVELTRKSRMRILEKFLKYSDRGELAIVVWICGSDGVMRSIQSGVAGSRVSVPSKFRFLLYSDLVENGLDRVKVLNWQGHEFKDIFE